MDFVCLKVGEAYGPEYVNEMFKRVDNLMPVGDFICYTDDPLNLNGNITVRGITPLYNDRMWWNKVMLLNPAHEHNALYLDLDTYMHKSIHGLNLKGQILRTAWFSDDMAMKVHYCNINSSVMRLFDNNFEKQYRDWYDNKEDTRVLRGGSWYDCTGTLRVASRNSTSPDNGNYGLGFRCVSGSN